LFTDPSFLEDFVRRWKSHERRFEFWHPFLWRILDGSQGMTPPPPVNALPAGGSGQIGGHSSPGGPSVPEPASALLMLSGLVAIALAALARRKFRWHSDTRQSRMRMDRCAYLGSGGSGGTGSSG
jgi:hypothetical protein